MLQIVLYISCLSPRISHFSKEPLFLLLENNVRNQDLALCVFIASEVSLLLGQEVVF